MDLERPGIKRPGHQPVQVDWRDLERRAIARPATWLEQLRDALLVKADRHRRRGFGFPEVEDPEFTAAAIEELGELLLEHGKRGIARSRMALRGAKLLLLLLDGQSPRDAADWLGVTSSTIKGDVKRLQALSDRLT
jgi:DNA-directed RNA polymerase specialized sigma24 family protein